MKAHKRKQFKLDILITNMCTYLLPLIFIVILHSSLYRNRQYAFSEISTMQNAKLVAFSTRYDSPIALRLAFLSFSSSALIFHRIPTFPA